MKAYIATNIIGSFAFDANGKIICYRLFKKDPEFIASKLQSTENIINEEKDVLSKLLNLGYKEIVCDKEIKLENIKCTQECNNIAKNTLKKIFRELAVELKFVKNQTELNEILTKVHIISTKNKLGKQKKDKIIIHTIGILNELDKTLNTFSERLKEWYGLYFPEAMKIIKSNEKFTELIAKYPDKELIKKSDYKELREYADISVGMEFSPEDLKLISFFSSSLFVLFKVKKEFSKYIGNLNKDIIPNLSAVAGDLLSARLLSLAGGLNKIAKLPSSTIQLLGAEKALFRHMRNKTKAPKYGILFSHPYVQDAPKILKGKVARLVAAKISLAAKIDYFSGEDKGAELKKDLEKNVKKLLNKNEH